MIHPLVADIRAEFSKNADPKNAESMRKYLKTDMPFQGIKTPLRRVIQNRVFKVYPLGSFDEYEGVVGELWLGDFREEKYAAIGLACKYREFIVMDVLPLYRMMIVTGAWWDFVDGIAAYLIGMLLENNPNAMKVELKRWIRDDDLWIRRSAILAQLRFKDRTDAGLLFGFCSDCLQEQSFWIRKAIGWALREYSKTDPQGVRDYIMENRKRMAKLTYREASKYV